MKSTNKVAMIVGAIGAGIGAILLLSKKAEAYPENIVLSNLTISPAEVTVGDPVVISLTATNLGAETATKEIVCEVL